MDLGYTEKIKLSTSELPYLSCEPPLVFEFNIQTTFGFNTRLDLWAVYQDLAEGGVNRFENDEFENVSKEIAQCKATDLLKDLASSLLLRVTRADGQSYELGTVETIESLIDSTSHDFVTNLLKSWMLRLAVEREKNKKKQGIYSTPSQSKNGKRRPAKE